MEVTTTTTGATTMMTKAQLTERARGRQGTMVQLTADAMARINAQRADAAARVGTDLPALPASQWLEVTDLMQRPGLPTDRIGIRWPDRGIASGVSLAEIIATR